MPELMIKDREIWDKFREGDKSALSYIYFQYFHSLFQYGIRFRDDPEFVKDCIQDVFFILIRTGKKLAPTDNIRFFLFKILKNVIYKGLEKEKKIMRIKEQTFAFTASFSLEEEILERENSTGQEKILLNALNHLDSRQREIIYLRYECGMEYDQVCEIMQIKNDSARKLVYRAIRSIRKIIDNQLKPPIMLFMYLAINMLNNIYIACPQE